MKSAERKLVGSLCETCPAKASKTMSAKLRGSSFRGRHIDYGESYDIDNCAIIVEDALVAVIKIANTDKLSREQDADVITAVFENSIPNCSGPTTELTESGLEALCSPASLSVDEFMRINY